MSHLQKTAGEDVREVVPVNWRLLWDTTGLASYCTSTGMHSYTARTTSTTLLTDRNVHKVQMNSSKIMNQISFIKSMQKIFSAAFKLKLLILSFEAALTIRSTHLT